ncbi:aldehyde dehydrogenase family protein [Amycolatopsis pithecellobii]|uniref:aldehyde dehydrogenase family protein n=1 Tax=Amycolatopsis pithecellobii TaxID=664692 RepID=UPI001408D89D|nr:aldehyde dehydrogenase family protein [Amycolatopsis pithecellobii]
MEGIFVAGNWEPLHASDRIESISPIDGTVIGHIAAAKEIDVDRAVRMIEPTLAPWAALGAARRAQLLKDFAAAILARADDLIEAEIVDAGLTRRTAVNDIQASIASIDLFVSYAPTLTGSTFSSPAGTMAYTVREPYGIVARIVPFNHPLMFAVQSAAPVLLAGNAVIIKPAEQTSLSALILADISKDVFPPGVFNVITGFGHEAGAAIAAHPAIRRIGFTGSVPTGGRLLELGAKHIKNVTLELGGKNPLVVTEDVAPDAVAAAAVSGMNFTHAGQSCQSTTRLLLPTAIYDDVIDRIVDRVGRLVIGDPREDATDIGPLAYQAHYDRVRNYIAVGHDEGARLVAGGRRPAGFDQGYYLQPTVFADVAPDMRIANEEIFGPVLAIMPYSDTDEAITIANQTEYGLICRVLAGTLGQAMEIGGRIKAGTLYVNSTGRRIRGMPFGGTKASGLGKQSCLEEVLSYTEEKSVVVGL